VEQQDTMDTVVVGHLVEQVTIKDYNMASKETVTSRKLNGMDAFTDKQWMLKRKRERMARKQRKLNRKK
jgi:hypothetical protein